MKTLKLSETFALDGQEKYDEIIRTTSGTLKVGGEYIDGLIDRLTHWLIV
jgi:hypothetical protein